MLTYRGTKEESGKDKRIKKNLRACFIYYAIFNNSALLYREAKALKEKDFDIDILCLCENAGEKGLHSYDGMNLYFVQSRSLARENYLNYFLKLLLFTLKVTFLLMYLGLKKKYTIVHVTSPPDFMVFTALMPKLRGAKIILDIHDIGPEFFMEKLKLDENRLIIKIVKTIEKFSAMFSYHVITVTDLWKAKLISRSVTDEKCTVLLNVPDETLFNNQSYNKVPKNGSFNLFYHGSLETYFGVDTLLHAMAIIKEQNPNIVLHIYGSGRLKSSFEEYVEKHQLENSVMIHNKVPFYMLPEILSNADIGIVPTKNSNFSDDTISMKSLEYISMGIPIIISSTRAHRYYFNDSMVRFFEPTNEVELASRIIEIYGNKKAMSEMRKHSQLFIEKYGWQNSKRIYYNIVD